MALFLGSLTAEVCAKVTEDSGWHQLETRHTIIHYQSIEDLKEFDPKIVLITPHFPV